MLLSRNKTFGVIFLLILSVKINAQKETNDLLDSIYNLTIEIELPPYYEVETDKFESFRLEGYTQENEKVLFNVFVISQVFAWQYANTKEIYKGNISEVLEGLISHYDSWDESYNVIAVGTASYEGNDTSELIRSEKRAINLANVLKKSSILKKNQRLFYLPLGRYQVKAKSSSKQQRRLIILVTLNDISDFSISSLEYSIKDAFYDADRFDLDMKFYDSVDKFKLKKFN